MGHRQAPAPALSTGRHVAPRVRRARVAGRRDGAWQDHPGDRRLRTAGAAERRRARAGRLPGLAEGGMGGADCALHRPRGSFVFGARAGAPCGATGNRVLHLVNYEQVLGDAADINAIFSPDIVVLDEAQRIKNWQTKTARRVKSLRSPYAFVLTGTPVENRIDETLFDRAVPRSRNWSARCSASIAISTSSTSAAAPIDYKNLAELRRRCTGDAAPAQARRREPNFPGRTVKTYFVPMVEEQEQRYEDYRTPRRRVCSRRRSGGR